jgi:hypothetical protein
MAFSCAGCSPDGGSLITFAECATGSCQGSFPDLVVTDLGRARPIIGVSVASLSGGGAALAFVQSESANPVLEYSECASTCGVAANWSTPLPVDNVQVSLLPPTLMTEGTTRGIAYAAFGAIRYAECTSGCTALSGWSVADRVIGSGSTSRPGLALFNGSGGLVRHVYGGAHYASCSQASCGSNAGWTASSYIQNFSADCDLRTDSTGLPAVAGIDNPNGFHYHLAFAQCTASPCTSAGNWTPSTVSTDWSGATPDRVGLQFSASDLATIAYQDNGGNVALQVQQAGGGFSKQSLTDCSGASPTGSLPTLLLSPGGGYRSAFNSTAPSDLPDGGSLNPGQAYLTNGP